MIVRTSQSHSSSSASTQTMTRRRAEFGSCGNLHVRRLGCGSGCSVGSTRQDGRAERSDGIIKWHSAGRAEDICTACTPALLTTIPHLQTHTFPSLANTAGTRAALLLFSLTCLTRTYDGVTHDTVPLALHHGTQSFDPRRRSTYASHQDPGPDRRRALYSDKVR
jgi:hypothetical protein